MDGVILMLFYSPFDWICSGEKVINDNDIVAVGKFCIEFLRSIDFSKIFSVDIGFVLIETGQFLAVYFSD